MTVIELQENPNLEASAESYKLNAIIRRHDLSKLNKTTIRFNIRLKNASKTTAPKWKQVLSASEERASQVRADSTSERELNSGFDSQTDNEIEVHILVLVVTQEQELADYFFLIILNCLHILLPLAHPTPRINTLRRRIVEWILTD